MNAARWFNPNLGRFLDKVHYCKPGRKAANYPFFMKYSRMKRHPASVSPFPNASDSQSPVRFMTISGF
jgi:hypothetical protein